MDKIRLRALLIEDDSADYQLINRSLRKSRATIELVWVKSLDDGLRQIANEKFDVALTDLSLPDSFGLTTVERIRSQDQKIPIIILTTLDDKVLEFTSLSAGAQDYIIKDEATPHTLEQAIHHAIQRQENVVEIQRLLGELEASHELLKERKDLLRKKNRRLRKLYKTAHEFVDNVSHEFRTPLTVIKDYISLVREGLLGTVNDEQCRMLDVAGIRVDELNNMVDDMLDVSKLESGLLGAWRRPCELVNIVELVCPPLMKKAELKDITFDVAVENTLPTVYCDAEKIGRVVINLLTNAMKFCGEPGAVKLWAREEPQKNEIVVGVSDNGPGIDKESLSEIFERFKQLKTDLKSSTKGFGLGLNIAKELIDMNFGDMSVESHPGQGTTFTFTVPLDNPPSVVKRYLERLHRLENGSATVSLVHAQIDKSTSAVDAEDSDAFFNYLLRRDDLLFRIGTHHWLYVLPIPRSETADFIERADREWNKTNRNRPFGPIPSFQMCVEGAWNASVNSDVILRRFTELMRSEEVHV